MIDVQKLLKESKRVEVTLYEPEIDSVFVKQFRKKNHLTQAALANIMGVKKKTIEKWEQGVNRVSGSSAVLLQLFDSNPELLRERYRVETIVPEKLPQTEYQSLTVKSLDVDAQVVSDISGEKLKINVSDNKNPFSVLPYVAAMV